MAISGNHYRLLKEHAPLFKRGGALLEIGEANWFGDTEPEFVLVQPRWKDTAEKILKATKPDLFDIAKDCYRELFAPSIVESVDLGGTKNAMRQDLNGLLKLPRRYDVVMNHGTAEHVFSCAQVFYSIHHACLPGGYMVHDAPLNPVDHGFYNFNPTLYYDLAWANKYELISLSVYWIGGQIKRFETRDQFHAGWSFAPNAFMYVVMRKGDDATFKIPQQGVYDGRLSEAGMKSWENNR